MNKKLNKLESLFYNITKMIEIQNIKKNYNRFKLSVETLKINKGESFGLVGNNGAGKSTLFMLLLDLIKATSGYVLFKEKDVSKTDEWKNYTASYLNEGFLIDFLNPKEYLEFVAKLHNKNNSDVVELVEKYKEFLADDFLENKKYIRDLSAGNKVKVGIMATLIGNPEIIILDEPFAHLDPRSQIQLKKILTDLNSQKQVTLLISSHDLNHITDVCKRISVLENGQIIKDITKNENTLYELEIYFSN